MKNISIKWNDEMQLNQYEIKDIVPMRYVESADKNG